MPARKCAENDYLYPMKHLIDTQNWSRSGNYAFFRDFVNPWYSVTTEIDCTEARAAAKASGRSFFLCYLYALLRAVHQIEEFRYRTDAEGRVVLHDRVDAITPVAVPGGTFHTVRIPYHADFEAFYRQAYDLIHHIPADGDPYRTEQQIIEQGDYDVILVSATPNLYFSSITYTQRSAGRPTDYPLLNIGRIVEREARLKMPFSLFVNHAFVDGAHIGALVEKFEECLKIAASVA